MIADIIHYSPRETMELCARGSVIVDVREAYLNAFKRFDVPRVIFIPQSEINERFGELPVDVQLIFADATGLHSKAAAQFLLDHGFKNVANMAGGLVEWERDLLPMITDVSERLTGSCMCQLRPREQKRGK